MPVPAGQPNQSNQSNQSDHARHARVSAARIMAVAGVLVAALGLALPIVAPGTPDGVTAILVCTGLILLALAFAWRRDAFDGCDTASPSLQRRYTRSLMASMGVYALVLFASMWLLQRVDAVPLRFAIALAPVVPIGFAVRAMIRFVRDLDEMQQRIELESVGIATLSVSMLYMTGGLLQQAQLLQVPGGVAMIWVFPLVCFTYGLAKAFVMRRYR